MTGGGPRTVLVQEVWADRVWAARPMTLVSESPEETILWFPCGTRSQAPTTPADRTPEDSRAERLATCFELGRWDFVEREWDASTLQIWTRGSWSAIWVTWRPDGSRWAYYGNIQMPYERTRCGFRTMDLVLDVIVELDGTTHLKDEDELEIFVERGLVSGELEERIRTEAESIIARARRGDPPFDGRFDSWRPAEGWPLPSLPDGWDALCR